MLKTVFVGGGTPSLLPIGELTQILKTLDQQFGIEDQAEISMEIDPGTFSLEKLQAYQDLGLNRFSLGVQAFQDELLARCGRSHRVQDIDKAIALFEQVGIKNFSLDLISGLPDQDLKQWQASLEAAIALNPTHLSCYDLVLEPVTAFGKQFGCGKKPLPDDETAAQMYRLAQSLLTQAGYDHYEISNYARPDYQCQHNRVYWKNQAYYGFGMGAASYTDGQRFSRPRTRESYYAWLKDFMATGSLDCPQTSECDRFLETLMLGLRLTEGVKLSELNVSSTMINQLFQTLQPYFHQQWVVGLDSQGKILSFLNQKNFDKIKAVSSIKAIALSDPNGFLFSNTVLTDLFQAFKDDLD
jgi:oxygen-independent coproporphyrinogen-3 oxidase